MSGDRSFCVAERTIYGFCWTHLVEPYLVLFEDFDDDAYLFHFITYIFSTFGHLAVLGSPDPYSGQPPGAESLRPASGR